MSSRWHTQRDRGDLPIMSVVVMLLGSALITVSLALVGLAGRAVPAQSRNEGYDDAVGLAKSALDAFYSQLELAPSGTPWSSWVGADGAWHSFGSSGSIQPCADLNGVAGLASPGGPGCWRLVVSESANPASAGAPGPAGATEQPQQAITAVAEAYTDCHGLLATCTAATVVQHFRQRDFLDYLYFTNQEILDPTFYAGQGAICSTEAACSEPAYVTGDVVDGPVHTNSPHIWVCGSPDFTSVVEATGDPVLESTGAANVNCGSPPANVDTVPNAPVLALPSGDRYLGHLAGEGGDPWPGQSGYGFMGSVTVVADGTSLTITPQGGSPHTVPYPATGVVYASGDLYVSGIVSGQVTFAAGSNIYVTGSLTYACASSGGAPSSGCNDYTGLIAGGSVFIDDSGSPVTVDAAMVALTHSVSINPETLSACSGAQSSCPTLTIWGAMASQYRGVFGTYEPVEVPSSTTTTTTSSSSSTTSSSTTTTAPVYVTHYSGFDKDFHYDYRLFHYSPPWLLSGQTGAWDASGQVVSTAPVPAPATTTTTAPAATTTTTTTPPLTCPTQPTTAPVPGEPWVYMADQSNTGNGEGGVAVGNPANQVVAQVPLQWYSAQGAENWGAWDIAANPNGEYVYVGDPRLSSGDGVDVMSTASNKVVNSLDIGSDGLVVSPDGKYLYTVGYPYFNAPQLMVWQVSTASGTVVATATLPSTFTLTTQTEPLAISPDGATLYVAGQDNSAGVQALAAVNTATMSVRMMDLPSVAGIIEGIAVSADGSDVYVGTAGAWPNSGLYTVAAVSGAVVGSHPFGTVLYVTVAPNGTVYVTDGSWVWVLAPGGTTVVAKIGAPGANEMEVTPDGNYLYVTEYSVQPTVVSETAIYSTALNCEVSYVLSGTPMPPPLYTFMEPEGLALVNVPYP
jgi:hypothetical protein